MNPSTQDPWSGWRERAGLTQAGLAAAAGITHSMVSMIESGERRPSLAVTARLVRALRLSDDEVVAAFGAASPDLERLLGRRPSTVQEWAEALRTLDLANAA